MATFYLLNVKLCTKLSSNLSRAAPLWKRKQAAVHNSESLNRDRDQMASGDTESAIASEVWFITTRLLIEGVLGFLRHKLVHSAAIAALKFSVTDRWSSVGEKSDWIVTL